MFDAKSDLIQKRPLGANNSVYRIFDFVRIFVLVRLICSGIFYGNFWLCETASKIYRFSFVSEERLKEMQKSRTEPGLQANLTCDLRNAAGFRTPVSLMYHCISCDRPIDLNMRGTHGPVVHNFPGKRSLGPYKTFELDQVRKGKESIYSTKLFFVLSFFFGWNLQCKCTRFFLFIINVAPWLFTKSQTGNTSSKIGETIGWVACLCILYLPW